MKRITITAPEFISGFMPQIPSSKSISNRLLILNELSPIKAKISNLSAADDTQVLLQLLKENKVVQDCHDGGTTSRFLIALRCAQQAKVTITGSEALQRRPLAPLLKALSYLGAEFSFNTTTQHLPLKITKGIDRGGEVYISAEISSQFISALMMIAPILQGGLTIHLEGEIVSGTYLSTTAAIMSRFGVEPIFEKDKIIISQQSYAATDTVVSCDF